VLKIVATFGNKVADQIVKIVTKSNLDVTAAKLYFFKTKSIG
jgi:hypothetical protein